MAEEREEEGCRRERRTHEERKTRPLPSLWHARRRAALECAPFRGAALASALGRSLVGRCLCSPTQLTSVMIEVLHAACAAEETHT